MTRICLSMIVRNEAHVIRRSLDTVKPFIHHWVIVDTGSTDGTQGVIREHMKDIPGALFERPWKDFAHNRNEAIELAVDKADYLMFLDADEEFVTPPGWRMPELTGDPFRVRVEHPPCTSYDRVTLVPTSERWRYVGVLHEGIECDRPYTLRLLEGVFLRENPEGARALDPRKLAKDAVVLEEALKNEPDNARYVFHLAEIYRGLKEWSKALEMFERRVTMGGWDQELYWAHLGVAHMAPRRLDSTITSSSWPICGLTSIGPGGRSPFASWRAFAACARSGPWLTCSGRRRPKFRIQAWMNAASLMKVSTPGGPWTNGRSLPHGPSGTTRARNFANACWRARDCRLPSEAGYKAIWILPEARSDLVRDSGACDDHG